MFDADVGYADYTVNIINKYFTEYFPRAVEIADGLRNGGYVETFIDTTHAWLVSLYLDCPPNLVLAKGIQLQVSVFAGVLTDVFLCVELTCQWEGLCTTEQRLACLYMR